jgi:hypothetical protein
LGGLCSIEAEIGRKDSRVTSSISVEIDTHSLGPRSVVDRGNTFIPVEMVRVELTALADPVAPCNRDGTLVLIERKLRASFGIRLCVLVGPARTVE